MGILDPDGFAGGRAAPRLRPRAGGVRGARLAARSVEQRIAFAYRIGLNNIAEEVIEHRDPPRRRPARLLAGGLRRGRPDAAAGGARAAARQAGRHPAAPGALLGARAAEHRPRLLRQPQRLRGARRRRGAADRRALRGDGGTACASAWATSTASSVRRSFDGRLLGQSWETPFVDVPDGPIDGATIEGDDRGVPRRVRARYGNRFDAIPVQGVTYRVELVVEADKVEYVAAERRRRRRRAPTRTRSSCAIYGDEPLQAASTPRRSCRPAPPSSGPAIIREELSTTFVCPGQVATVGALRRARDRAGEHRTTHRA